MSVDADPIVGNWYQHADKGPQFEVVAVDEDNGIVEIQHYDGSVEEIDLDTWYTLEIEPIEPPENWTGPMDDIENDDLGYTETDMETEEWSRPLEEWPQEPEAWERGEDEWGEEREGGPEEEPWREEE